MTHEDIANWTKDNEAVLASTGDADLAIPAFLERKEDDEIVQTVEDVGAADDSIPEGDKIAF